jgi:hypothetical protein
MYTYGTEPIIDLGKYKNGSTVDMYARFVPKECTVTLDFNDGITPPKKMIVKYGEPIDDLKPYYMDNGKTDMKRLTASRSFYAGGFASGNEVAGKISLCYAKSTINVIADEKNFGGVHQWAACGGFCSINNGISVIENCYSFTNIKTENYIYTAGFLGRLHKGGGAIKNCYSVVEQISGTTGYITEFSSFGESGSSISNCFSTGATEKAQLSPFEIYKSTVTNLLRIEETPDEDFIFNKLGWDKKIWVFDGDYPHLAWETQK